VIRLIHAVDYSQAGRDRVNDLLAEVGCSMVLGDRQLWIVNFGIGESLAIAGSFKLLKKSHRLGMRKRPDVDPFKFVCTHSASGAGVKEQESHRDKLLVLEFDHQIQDFKTYPRFLKS
jgi:hypothetical protein